MQTTKVNYKDRGYLTHYIDYSILIRLKEKIKNKSHKPDNLDTNFQYQNDFESMMKNL
jgi:hypothetical protein